MTRPIESPFDIFDAFIEKINHTNMLLTRPKNGRKLIKIVSDHILDTSRHASMRAIDFDEIMPD
ncbi:hypothetical protein ACJ72_08853 [Emergomyces africanus]|uniref:Uncharacterized protein n=1 Tax=Emergomyces africanus TaxID=1955775 RepID=A0A1B7NJ96_9EURO|nr:hypothetical protein ACJ72_08853 [Emergomyces africanus]